MRHPHRKQKGKTPKQIAGEMLERVEREQKTADCRACVQEKGISEAIKRFGVSFTRTVLKGMVDEVMERAGNEAAAVAGVAPEVIEQGVKQLIGNADIHVNAEAIFKALGEVKLTSKTREALDL